MTAVTALKGPYHSLFSSLTQTLELTFPSCSTRGYKIIITRTSNTGIHTDSSINNRFYSMREGLEVYLLSAIRKFMRDNPLGQLSAASTSLQLELFVAFRDKRYKYYSTSLLDGGFVTAVSPLLSASQIDKYYKDKMQSKGVPSVTFLDKKGCFTVIDSEASSDSDSSCLVL